MRPRLLVLVVGTGTEVGKTWAAAATLAALRTRGVTVAARKPAQSFAPGESPTDADVLAAATGEAPDVVCPPHRAYPVPMAPFMAADTLGRPPFTIDELAAEIRWPAGIEVGLVETAGGVRSPISSDGGDAIDLAARLRPDALVLVADAGLGTINATRLCLDALGPWRDRTAVFLNRYDARSDLHARNASWLADHAGAAAITRSAADLNDWLAAGTNSTR